jgi:branched-subunit amino acid ABC-type transport system permease component
MLYRENGQFKTTYVTDQQIFPILQDRIGIALLLAFAFVGVPLLVQDDYLFRAILIPFLILSLAALGLNILVGYCGQISLGTGAFMAVGAYAAYNLYARIDGMPTLAAILLGGVFAMIAGVLFGTPSLRIKGLYLAVATLAAQFFWDWAFLRIKWFTNESASGSVTVANLSVFGISINTPMEKYLFCLTVVIVFAWLAKNLVRSHIGREWMAIRDMDVAASVIGIRPVYAKLRLRSQQLHGGRGRRDVGLRAPGRLGACGLLHRSLLPAALHDHHRWPGLDHGQLLRRCLHRRAADLSEPVPALGGRTGGRDDQHRRGGPYRVHDLRLAHRLLPHRRAPRPGQAVVHRQGEAAPVALPALRRVFRAIIHAIVSHRTDACPFPTHWRST